MKKIITPPLKKFNHNLIFGLFMLMLTIMAGCKKDQPEINNEEILWQQLQNDSMFNALVNIDFISPQQDKLLLQQAAGNNSLYRAAIKQIYEAKIDSIASLSARLKAKYIGFSDELVKRGRSLRVIPQKTPILLIPNKKMDILLDEVTINFNCAEYLQRFNSLIVLKNTYDITMSICGDEHVYLSAVYNLMYPSYTPNANLSLALTRIGSNYNSYLQSGGECRNLIDFIKLTDGNSQAFEANFMINIGQLNDMYNLSTFIQNHCHLNQSNDPDNNFWITDDGSSPPPPPAYIKNKATDPCIYDVVNALIDANKNIEGKMAEIIKNFDQNKDLNINIYDGVNSNGKAGNMSRWELIGSKFTADIRLHTSYFKGQDGASKESLAAVLIHEVLHGYFVSENINLKDTSNLFHNMMVENYIEPMANYLKSSFGISRKDAFSLAWNGVIDSDIFAKAGTDKLFEYTYLENNQSHTISVSKQEIMNRAVAYNGNTNYAEEGKKGTKTCPN